MKHIRVTARIDPERAPRFFTHLAESPDVEETRVVDWNMAAADAKTLLYAVEGDAAAFAAAARETRGIDSVSLAATDEDVSYALLAARESAVPVFSLATEAIARAGLVVSKPMVYRSWDVYAHAVGEPAALQAALDGVPDGMDVQIESVGQYPCHRAAPASQLSDRQREAVTAAIDLGYYDHPRAATHEDIAAELDCAPATVSEHLQKAEARLVRSGSKAFTPPD